MRRDQGVCLSGDLDSEEEPPDSDNISSNATIQLATTWGSLSRSIFSTEGSMSAAEKRRVRKTGCSVPHALTFDDFRVSFPQFDDCHHGGLANVWTDIFQTTRDRSDNIFDDFW